MAQNQSSTGPKPSDFLTILATNLVKAFGCVFATIVFYNAYRLRFGADTDVDDWYY